MSSFTADDLAAQCPDCRPSNLTIHGEKKLRDEIEHATADAAVMRELAKRYRSALQRIEEALTFKIAIGPTGALSIAQQALQTKDSQS